MTVTCAVVADTTPLNYLILIERTEILKERSPRSQNPSG